MCRNRPNSGVTDPLRITAQIGQFMRQHGISKIGLFGSYSRQEQKKGSDIDILVDFQQDKETFDNFMAVCDLLDKIIVTG